MLIKKVLIFILVISISGFNVYSVGEPSVSARSAVVLEADTGEVLFSKNADFRLSMASTTKIMTALLAVESGKLNCYVTAKEDVSCEGTAIGIKKGDCFTLETLTWAILLESGNDAALLTADFLSGSEEAFSELMNEKADQIGMKSTNFVTSSGLDAPDHYTTAYDMALLASYAIKNPIFRNMCSAKNKSVEYIKPEITRTYTNHNKLLKMYDGVFGVKTGFTKKSGRCLVSACQKNGITLVAVTLNAPDDWNDHIKMYDYSFSVSENTSLKIDIPTEIAVYGSYDSSLKLKSFLPKNGNISGDDIRCELFLPKFVYAPVKKDEIIGNIKVYSDNKLIYNFPICSCEDVDITEHNNKPEYNFSYKIKHLINEYLKG